MSRFRSTAPGAARSAPGPEQAGEPAGVRLAVLRLRFVPSSLPSTVGSAKTRSRRTARPSAGSGSRARSRAACASRRLHVGAVLEVVVLDRRAERRRDRGRAGRAVLERVPCGSSSERGENGMRRTRSSGLAVGERRPRVLAGVGRACVFLIGDGRAGGRGRAGSRTTCPRARCSSCAPLTCSLSAAYPIRQPFGCVWTASSKPSPTPAAAGSSTASTPVTGRACASCARSSTWRASRSASTWRSSRPRSW